MDQGQIFKILLEENRKFCALHRGSVFYLIASGLVFVCMCVCVPNCIYVYMCMCT